MEQPQATDPQEVAQQYRGFVIARLKAGASTQAVVSELSQRGVDATQARQLVATLDAQVVVVPEEEQVGGGSVMLGVVGAALAAVIGGLIWGLIAGKTGYEIGFLAWGIGVLSGFAVVIASGGKKGFPLQVIAVAASILGILIGKYFTFYFVLKDVISEQISAEAAAEVSLLSGATVNFFFENLSAMSSVWDILWVILAFGSAWAIARPCVSVEAD
jgi:hypothetical protein